MPRRSKVPNQTFSDAVPFKIDGVYCKLIPLTKGLYAIVDAADYDWLSSRRWGAIWSPSVRSHYAIATSGDRISMHRLILGLGKGDPREGDHVDPWHTLDNRRKNIRIATLSQQQHNKRRPLNNVTGFKGVSVDRQRNGYRAQMLVDGKRKVIAVGHDPALLHEKYKAAVKAHRGEFARAV